MRTETGENPLTLRDRAMQIAADIDKATSNRGIGEPRFDKYFFDPLSRFIRGANPRVYVRVGLEDLPIPEEHAEDTDGTSDWMLVRVVPQVPLANQFLRIVLVGWQVEGREYQNKIAKFNRGVRRGEIPVTVFDKNGIVEPKKRRLTLSPS